MNLSYQWLKELVKTEASPEELGEMLTHAGCAVEEMEKVGDDVCLVAEVTTNRPDWLCHNGAAHEIAALTGAELNLPKIELNASGPTVTDLTSVEVEEAARTFCPRYTARVIQGVKVEPSPDWLRNRLEAIGQRSINTIVDITNLVCFEMNQPLHAFDYDLLAENRIVVRMAKDGEPFKAITGEEEKLSSDMMVIADAERAVALAGVKGGANSEVHEGTVNVLLESAWFQPQQVRRSSRRTRMSSESSYRFERGIDPGMTERASARAAALILELAGGTLAEGVIDTCPDLSHPWEVEMRFDRCDRILGVQIERPEVEKIFSGLGLEILHSDAAVIRVKVPSFRQDLTREIDLIEEVIRVAGYDRVPEKVTMSLQVSHQSAGTSGARLAREILVGLGYFETWNDSFVPESWLKAFPLPDGQEAVRVMNPINAERPMLRTSLMPSLLEIRRNNRSVEEARLFDFGHSYEDGKAVVEPMRLAILDDRGLSAVRGALEAILAGLRAEGALTVEPCDTVAAYETGSGATLLLAGQPIGTMGLTGAEQVKQHDLVKATALLEVDFGAVCDLPRRTRLYEELPRFPGVRRDIALVVPESVQWKQIEGLVARSAEKMESLQIESVFRGKGVAKGMKSVAFSMLFRDPDRSLVDDEVNAIRDRIVKALTQGIEGASQR